MLTLVTFQNESKPGCSDIGDWLNFAAHTTKESCASDEIVPVTEVIFRTHYVMET